MFPLLGVVYFDQRLGAAHPNAGRNSSKTTEFKGIHIKFHENSTIFMFLNL
jgi:hypothetical protein